MNTSAIVAIIMGVLMMVLSFVLYPTLNNAMDDLYLYWVPSCKLNNDRFVRAYVGVESGTADNTYIAAGDNKGAFYGSGLSVVADNSGCRNESGTFSIPTYGQGFPPEINDAATTTVWTSLHNEVSNGWRVVSPTSRPETTDADTAYTVTIAKNTDLYNERGEIIHSYVDQRHGTYYVNPTVFDPFLSFIVASDTARFVFGHTQAQPGHTGPAPDFDPVTINSARLSQNAQWVDVPSLLDQFGGIGRLVLSVMPIMVLASFLGLVAMGLIDYGRGMSQGGIAGAVGAAIIQLIVVIVLLEVLPTVIDAMIDANQSATGGRFSVNSQFSGIMGIIFAALPLLLVVGILGISGFMLFQQGRNFRSGGGFSFGG